MIENLYIHVPFCKGKCAYCAFYSEDASAHSLYEYVHLPAQELDGLFCAGVVDPEELHIRHLYIGGGTPSLLGGSAVGKMADEISRRTRLCDLDEFSIEINPADVTPRLFRELKSAGVTRISLGVQSFSNRILRFAGRRHDAAMALRAIDEALDAGFDDVGIDLIAGFPQDGGDFEKTFVTLEKLLPSLKHVSLYALTLEPGTSLHRSVCDGAVRLPAEDECIAEIAKLSSLMADGALQRYEVSNYARREFACRYNLDVWRGCDYLGLGPSAASRCGFRRWTNFPDLHRMGAGQCRTVETLESMQDAQERFFFRLRLAEGFSVERDLLSSKALAPHFPQWEALFARFVQEGMLIQTDVGFAPTDYGMDMCDFMLRELYLVNDD